ncbi:hypothetical protein MJO28_005904 [Puccinia striiformis f. sp. tritici]|uniref:Uncharacterized protein n=3 Tax=Puccinia striiformis TaxID=27350 RepID=A0A0L0UX45_9BASI|nr:hypothetical protein MJO28_005904 [Puccinia striiformis f. sp. tritici]KAI9609752.1 hypothetical protein KEM48_002792 [Puccinia striiformis f. sp. tritici PST-130]KAI9626589.1 hypothetical protein H4Q26_017798 [Puccinia striiformis f. sp. tritici PST-130]KNE91486.1 hypothetical protein PSTG_15083 [Puccinia striiformis f. sp. tritici PST-78]POW11446.1 hypothetical protein PSHT_08373 [Puccinia striiformis]
MANSLAKSMMVSGAAPCMEIGTAHSGDDLVADLCRNRPEIPIRPARAGSAVGVRRSTMFIQAGARRSPSGPTFGGVR